MSKVQCQGLVSMPLIPDGIRTIHNPHTPTIIKSAMEMIDINGIRRSNLGKLIEQLGGTSKVADKIGMGASYISQLMSNTKTARKMGNVFARRLEKACQLPYGWMDVLHTDELLKEELTDKNIPASAYREAVVNRENYRDDLVRIPLQSAVPLIGWHQIMDKFNYLDAPRVPCMIEHSPETFALPVIGTAMSPRYQEGDLLFIDPMADVAHGHRVLVQSDGSYMVRTLEITPEGEYLFAENPDHPERKIRREPHHKIIGPVILMQRTEL